MSEKIKTGGFIAGTRLFCSRGLVPIECIEVGEKVLTRDVGSISITEITQRNVEARFVKFQPYALSEAGPMSELLLPLDQLVHVRDWRAREVFGVERALVEARALIDDIFIRMTEIRKQVLFQVSFSSPHMLYLEGIEVRSADSVCARGALMHTPQNNFPHAEVPLRGSRY